MLCHCFFTNDRRLLWRTADQESGAGLGGLGFGGVGFTHAISDDITYLPFSSNKSTIISPTELTVASVLQILVVEDFEPFRRFIGSLFSQNRALHIVAEVSDGTEAARKARLMKPDLVLLDIGLPMIGGLEAARQIRELSPETKILFLSAYDSVDVVRAALDAGACGYVVKADAGAELVKGVEAVARGERFVSSRLKGKVSVNGEIAEALI